MDDKLILGQKLTDYAYHFAPGLWVVTAYYNPVGYKSRRDNYEIFAHLLRRSGIPMLTVECAFGDQPYDLPESVDVVRVRSASMLWQKERLLNLAISWLPPSCTAVAWLDCDIVFANPNWARETMAQLRRAPMVQVFETCNRLPQDCARPDTVADVCASFGSLAGNNPAVLASGDFFDHGHTGYGWAARKEVLDRHGLYEYAVAGSSDHFMAHAALDDIHSPCIQRMLIQPEIIRHFRDWAEPFQASVRCGLGTVSGQALHLWHGDLADRKYVLRHVELARLDFNPYTDLVAVPGKPLEFRPGLAKPALIDWFRSYFDRRHEDGLSAHAA